MEDKIKKLDKMIEERREKRKFFEQLLNMFETGSLKKEYFEDNIQRLISEINGLVDAYNALVKED